VEEGSTHLGATQEKSASLDNANHHEICKYDTRDSNYRKILNAIKALVSNIQRERERNRTFQTPTSADMLSNAFAQQGYVPQHVLQAAQENQIREGDILDGQPVSRLQADMYNSNMVAQTATQSMLRGLGVYGGANSMFANNSHGNNPYGYNPYGNSRGGSNSGKGPSGRGNGGFWGTF
jgi:hypothetical protein